MERLEKCDETNLSRFSHNPAGVFVGNIDVVVVVGGFAFCQSATAVSNREMLSNARQSSSAHDWLHGQLTQLFPIGNSLQVVDELKFLVQLLSTDESVRRGVTGDLPVPECCGGFTSIAIPTIFLAHRVQRFCRHGKSCRKQHQGCRFRHDTCAYCITFFLFGECTCAVGTSRHVSRRMYEVSALFVQTHGIKAETALKDHLHTLEQEWSERQTRFHQFLRQQEEDARIQQQMEVKRQEQLRHQAIAQQQAVRMQQLATMTLAEFALETQQTTCPCNKHRTLLLPLPVTLHNVAKQNGKYRLCEDCTVVFFENHPHDVAFPKLERKLVQLSRGVVPYQHVVLKLLRVLTDYKQDRRHMVEMTLEEDFMLCRDLSQFVVDYLPLVCT